MTGHLNSMGGIWITFTFDVKGVYTMVSNETK